MVALVGARAPISTVCWFNSPEEAAAYRKCFFRLGLWHGRGSWDRGLPDRRGLLWLGKRRQFRLAPATRSSVSPMEVGSSDGQAVLIKELSKRVEILWRFLEEKMAVVAQKQSHLHRLV